MLSIMKYIMEADEEQPQDEKPSLKKRLATSAKKFGDNALEVGNSLSAPLYTIGVATKNPHMQILGSLLPAANSIKRQFKAGA